MYLLAYQTTYEGIMTFESTLLNCLKENCSLSIFVGIVFIVLCAPCITLGQKMRGSLYFLLLQNPQKSVKNSEVSLSYDVKS